MASYKFDPKKRRARILFWYEGRLRNRTVPVENEREAQRLMFAVEQTLEDLKKFRLIMPPDADPVVYIMSGGKQATKPKPSPPEEPAACEKKTLGEVFQIYQDTLTPGSKEANSIATEKVHARHFRRVLDEKRVLDELDVNVIQQYVDTRSRDGVGRATIQKELTSLRMTWGWALKRGYVASPLTWRLKDLTFPKGNEKPPFQTWTQIERKLQRGGLTQDEIDALWESLWLSEQETQECLGWVRENGVYPFISPMFAFAAYTGARRGEMTRSEVDDWEFDAGILTIREKKSDRSKVFTHRIVPIHPDLAGIMKGWFEHHPGGKWTLATEDRQPLTPVAASKYFRRTVAGGKWDVLRDWHVFRHSLASNLASRGEDQRIINEILGHRTEDMERRYRHLLPQKQAQAISSLFQVAG